MLTTAGLCGSFSCCPSPSRPHGSDGGQAVRAAAARLLAGRASCDPAAGDANVKCGAPGRQAAGKAGAGGAGRKPHLCGGFCRGFLLLEDKTEAKAWKEGGEQACRVEGTWRW